jgi:hypothetical protein
LILLVKILHHLLQIESLCVCEPVSINQYRRPAKLTDEWMLSSLLWVVRKQLQCITENAIRFSTCPIIVVGPTRVYPKDSGLRLNEINNNKHSLRSNTRGYGGKLTRLTHKIAVQLHLVAESSTICGSRSRRPVRKLLDTPSYEHYNDHLFTDSYF